MNLKGIKKGRRKSDSKTADYLIEVSENILDKLLEGPETAECGPEDVEGCYVNFSSEFNGNGNKITLYREDHDESISFPVDEEEGLSTDDEIKALDWIVENNVDFKVGDSEDNFDFQFFRKLTTGEPATNAKGVEYHSDPEKGTIEGPEGVIFKGEFKLSNGARIYEALQKVWNKE